MKMENKENNDRTSIGENVVMKVKLENAKKEGQTKGALATGIISLVLLLLIGVLGYSLYKRDHNSQLALMDDQKNAYTRQLTERDSMMNDWLLTFDQIEQNLNTIKQKEKLLTVESSGSEFTNDRRGKILEDIRQINTLIEENKKKIAALNSQLKNSGVEIKGLQTRIASLEESMKQYETEITGLKSTLVSKDFEIGQLNNTMVALNDTITMKVETINDQTYRLNQAFIISGTFRELKEKGLVSKEGGFLGLGRKEFLSEDFADSLFAEIDVTQTKTIPVNSKEVKLITEHPTSSYQLVHEGEDMIAYIEIKDPAEFWKISKYAVVEISK